MLCFTKETIQWRVHCRWPATSGKSQCSSGGLATDPEASPVGVKAVFTETIRGKNVTRAAQNQNLCQQRHHKFPKSLPSLARKKDRRYTSCANRTLAGQPRAHSGSKDEILAAVQAGHHVHAPEGSGMTPPSSTPGPTAGQCPPRSRPSYFTDEETESKRTVHACSWDTTRQLDDKVYLPFRWCFVRGTDRNVGTCAF